MIFKQSRCRKIEYIHQNLARAQIVKHPEDYLYSSARNYKGLSNYADVLTPLAKSCLLLSGSDFLKSLRNIYGIIAKLFTFREKIVKHDTRFV